MPASKKSPEPTPETSPEVSAAPSLDLSALDKIEDFIATDLTVIPEKVKEAVEHAHAYWKDHPDKWRVAPVASEEAGKELLKLFRKYGDNRAPEPVTVRTHNVNDPTKLVFRVTDRQTRTAK